MLDPPARARPFSPVVPCARARALAMHECSKPTGGVPLPAWLPAAGRLVVCPSLLLLPVVADTQFPNALVQPRNRPATDFTMHARRSLLPGHNIARGTVPTVVCTVRPSPTRQQRAFA